MMTHIKATGITLVGVLMVGAASLYPNAAAGLFFLGALYAISYVATCMWEG